MKNKKGSLFQQTIDYVPEAISVFLIVILFFLHTNATKYMGLYRDIIYRNNWIMSNIFTTTKIYLYVLISVLLIIMSIVMYIKLRTYSGLFGEKESKRMKRYIAHIVLSTITFLGVLLTMNQASLLIYPLILLSLAMILILSLLRLIVTWYDFFKRD